MRQMSLFFFYTYVGLVIIAGFWGAFINPYFDFDLLFSLDPHTLTDHVRINLLSQYRFLRALELGFGLFSILFMKKIFNEKTFNVLFLIIMGSGILARVISWMVDGKPNTFSQLFMFYELAGWIIIFMYTHKIRHHRA